MSNSDAWINDGIFKPGDRCDIKQYKMLKRYSKSGDTSEWNNWRKNNPDEEIWLVGATLFGALLQKADLQRANLQGANLWEANLQGTNLSKANLQDTALWEANLQGAELLGTNLQGASFNYAIVDGKTLIAGCEIDENTVFTGVGLDAARVEPGLKQLLEYNIRRKRWEEWYKQHHLLRIPVWLFWQMSNYGRSTRRIIFTFFFLAMLFAAIYCVCGWIWHPGIVANLFEDAQGPIPGWLVPVRAGYFSIVTMTTLGFGDLYAEARNLAGHVLLTLQVMLGYVLLGALITRFAILFTSGGPAGKFTKKTP